MQWSPEQTELLQRYWLSRSCKELALMFGTTEEGVRHRAKRLGLPAKIGRRGNIRTSWTDAQRDELRAMHGKFTYRQIGDKIGRSAGSVEQQAIALGLPKVSKSGVRRWNSLAPMEIAPGHFAVDEFSYEALQRAMA